MTSKTTLLEQDLFVQMIENRKLSDTTIKSYRSSLEKYTEYTEMDLEELLEEAEQEEDDGIKIRKRKIKKHIMGFKKHLDECDYSPTYKRTILARVKSFYHEYEIQLPRLFNRKTRSDKQQDSLYVDLPTIEEIGRLLEFSKPNMKSAILISLSSGMSRSELCSLTFKHFYDSIPLENYPKTMKELLTRLGELDNIIPLWNINRIKTGKQYFTFSSPEAFESIVNYLKNLNYNFPDYNPKPTDNLLKTKFNKPMGVKTIGASMIRANKRAGFDSVDNTTHVPKITYIRMHILRKIFASTLEKNKMPHLMTRWLLGHTIDSTTSAYFKADPQAVKEEYITVLDQLTTNKVEIKIVNQYEDLNNENIKLKGELEDIKSKLSRLDDLDKLLNKPKVKRVIEEELKS